MAAIRNRGQTDYAAAVPLADGRIKGGAAPSPPSGDRIECHIKVTETLENSVLFGTSMV